jgi:manganese/zinc/iron transport system permease protein
MESQYYFNPYSGQTFFGFFIILFQRLWFFVSGQLAYGDMVSDEIQIVVLVGVAASTSLVGCFLVLRKMTMLANSLSHTILLGIVLVYLGTCYGFFCAQGRGNAINIQAMLAAAVLMGILTAFLTEFLTKTAKLQEDASIGIAFTSLFALGVILLTMVTRNAHIGTEVVMGNVDALQMEDARLVWIVFFMNIVLIVLFFKEYKITTFDPGLAHAFGISLIFFNYLLMVQASITAVGAFRSVGVLMVLSFITGPVLTARLLTHNLKRMLFYAALLGSLASVIGIALSRHILSVHEMALSTAGIVVCTIAALYLVVLLIKMFPSNIVHMLHSKVPKVRG